MHIMLFFIIGYTGSLHLDYSRIKPSVINVDLVSIKTSSHKGKKVKGTKKKIVLKTLALSSEKKSKGKAININKKKVKKIDAKENFNNTLERLKTETEQEEFNLKDTNHNITTANIKGKVSRKQILTYKQKLAINIQRNWVYSKHFSKDIKHKEVRILIKIMPDGSIREIWTKKTSGDIYLDETATKSIKKSIPFPILPKGMPFYNIVLVFTPEGVK